MYHLDYGHVIDINNTSSPFNTLRCINYSPPAETYRKEELQKMVTFPDQRTAELIIAITMYNESPEDLKRTMQGIVENLVDLQSTNTIESPKITIALVSDGADKVNPKTEAWLERHGYFDPNHKHYLDEGQTATMSFFSTSKHIPLTVTEANPVGGSIELRFIYLLKRKNAKKLDSHSWILEGLAPILESKYVVFLDTGTSPKFNAIRMLINEMKNDTDVAGVCGEITIESPYKRALESASPVILAQHFEYKMANAFDKSFESLFGFVSVLPGAFCAFQMGPWVRERGINVDTGPLSGRPIAQYLLPLTRKQHDGYDSLGPFNKNMYLAEDRILCFELVCKNQNILRYVKGAVAETDPMDSLSSLISQRRRWLNGSLFAKLYAFKNFSKLLNQSTHGASTKVLFTLQFLYYFVQLVMDWFCVSFFFIQFRIATDLFLKSSTAATATATATNPSMGDPSISFSLQGVSYGLQFLYIAVILLLVLLSLSSKTKDSIWPHRVAFLVFGFSSFGTIILTSWYILSGTSLLLKMALITSFSTYFVVGLIHGELHHVVLTILPYLFALPSFINIFQIYSMGNLDDVSWGTRPETPDECSNRTYGSSAAAQPIAVRNGYSNVNDFIGALNEGTDNEHVSTNGGCCSCFNNSATESSLLHRPNLEAAHQVRLTNFKLKTMALWLFSNLILVLVTSTSYELVPQRDFMGFIMAVLFASMVVRLIGSVFYACQRYKANTSPWWSCCVRKSQ